MLVRWSKTVGLIPYKKLFKDQRATIRMELKVMYFGCTNHAGGSAFLSPLSHTICPRKA
jgi:hypothetical protein